MKLIDVTNQKGGVAKSTTVANFVFYIGNILNKKVLHIDGDEQGNSGDTLSQYQVSGFDSYKFFEPAKLNVPSFSGNILSARSSSELVKIEKNVTGLDDSGLIQTLADRIKDVADHFDYIVVDTAGSNSRIANSFLLVADFALIPTTIDEYAMKITQRSLKRVIGVQKSYRPDLVFLGLLPTRIDTRSPTVKKDLESLLVNYSQYVLPVKTTERQPYRTAASRGVPVWELKSSGSERDTGKELLQVFDLIAKRIGVEQ
ncbi:ParA family protein [Klebsiella pneumoniae]